MRMTLLTLLVLAQSTLFFVIPSLGSSIFLSPDETANAAAARTFAQAGDLRVHNQLLREFPWLHPRSFVTQETAMVPVGFLGLPVLLAIVWTFVGEWGLILYTPLLAISVTYPLWRLSAGWGRRSQVATIATWMSFPTVILYANRGLFANVPVVCLTIWACYLLWERRTIPRGCVAGMCIGGALAMRPTEIIWILPLIALAWRCRRDRLQHREGRPLVCCILLTFLPLAFTSFVAWKTYGSPFAVGYFLRDPIATNAIMMNAETNALASSPRIQWPFGIHPMNVMRNVWFYLVEMLWPWTAALVAAFAVVWKKRDARPYLGVGIWTFGALVFIYGHGIYQDHVGVNVVSFGNSFVRYLIPLAVLVSFAVGVLVAKAPRHLAIAGSVFLAIAGTNLALRGGDESVIPARHELEKYLRIRTDVFALINGRHPSTAENVVVLSDRGDKIFFPSSLLVTSPIPPATFVRSLLLNERIARIHVFSPHPLTQEEFFAWQNVKLKPVIATTTNGSILYSLEKQP